MRFLAALVVDGALAGAIYALIALAFVVVYKASRVINFALGEWIMLAVGLVAAGLHALSLGLASALLFAVLGMTMVAIAFNRIVLRPLVGRPVIAMIMVTIGFGALLRGATTLTLGGVPRRMVLPLPTEPLAMGDIVVSTEKLLAALVAVVAVVV